jgi:hypothetical protein
MFSWGRGSVGQVSVGVAVEFEAVQGVAHLNRWRSPTLGVVLHIAVDIRLIVCSVCVAVCVLCVALDMVVWVRVVVFLFSHFLIFFFLEERVGLWG